MNPSSAAGDLEQLCSAHVAYLFGQIDRGQFDRMIRDNLKRKRERAASDGHAYFQSLLMNIWFLSSGSDRLAALLTELAGSGKAPGEVELVRRVGEATDAARAETANAASSLERKYQDITDTAKRNEQAEFDYSYHHARNALWQSFLFTCFGNKPLADCLLGGDGGQAAAIADRYITLYTNLLIDNVTLSQNNE